MSCKECDELCRQGRDCPHRRTWDNHYYTRYLNLMETIKAWIKRTFR